jgi:hypothetical protein
MLNDTDRQKKIQQAAKRALAEAKERQQNQPEIILPKEINGYKGKEPTRYQDWERKGIICDF